MTQRTVRSGEFTGRHMLAAMLAFFGVIIAVNITMAVFAQTSWTGFVVRNSYVASQEFNGKVAAARAQAALGWTETLIVADGRVTFTLADRLGAAVDVRSAIVTFHRPSKEAEDVVVQLTPYAAGGFSADFVPREGAWVLETVADVGGERPWRETTRMVVENGVAR